MYTTIELQSEKSFVLLLEFILSFLGLLAISRGERATQEEKNSKRKREAELTLNRESKNFLRS